MIAVFGVNEISIEFHTRNEDSIIIGPYKEQIFNNHKNEGISYLTIPYIVPRNVDIIVDLTFNKITSLILNDFSLKYNKRFVSVVYHEGKVLVKSVSKRSCIRCLIEDSKSVSNYIVVNNIIVNPQLLIGIIEDSIKTGKSYVIQNGIISDLVFFKGCDSCESGKYKFIDGEYGEMVNENCGNDSSAVFPIDDREVDIDFISKELVKAGVEIIDKSDDYLSFFAEGKKMFLFRNSRLMISDVRSKEEAEYLFRKYVGS